MAKSYLICDGGMTIRVMELRVRRKRRLRFRRPGSRDVMALSLCELFAKVRKVRSGRRCPRKTMRL